ncbi:DUF3889 domain-containing protein [Paenibacillus sp. TAB 01]|uniref:DUF3889 domain-containing protein n=1 Tax=Paenibacillus sp. TAB 01 TaxID=3368988 RepID=UPI003751B4F8
MKLITRSNCTIQLFLVSLIVALMTMLPSTLFAKEPEYAKWSRLAFSEIKKKYPNASVIDYLHVERKKMISETVPDEVEETFKFWLNENGKQFAVYVRIRYVLATDKVLLIKLTETTR